MNKTGKTIGKIENNNISFEKLMPKYNQINSKGERKNVEGKHPTLYYRGNLSYIKLKLLELEKIKKRIRFLFGIIPIYFRPGNGSRKINLN